MLTKPFSFALSTALGIALLFAGCDSDNASARISEKSATYATLKTWQKKYIERGDIATGFTPDMVYMAIGQAPKVKQDSAPAGGSDELWTYPIFYLPPNATHYRPATEKVTTPYEAARTTAAPAAQSQTVSGNARAASTTATTGSLEPADLQSYTLNVSFHNGKVVKYWITRN